MPSFDGQVFDRIISGPSNSAAAYDSSGTGTGMNPPIGLRSLWHRGTQIVLASPTVVNEGHMLPRVRQMQTRSGTGGGFNLGASSRSWDFATKTVVATAANQVSLTIQYRDFADTNNPDKIELVVTVTNLSTTQTIDWAYCHLLPAVVETNVTSGPSMFVAAAPVSPPTHPCRLRTGTWAVVSCNDSSDLHAVGFAETSILGDNSVPKERNLSLTLGCLESVPPQPAIYQRVTAPLGLVPGQSKTVTVVIEFATTDAPIQSYPIALSTIQNWTTRYLAREPATNYATGVTDRRTVAKVTNLADSAEFQSANNPSGWRGMPGTINARPRQGGESDSTFQTRMNAFADWFVNTQGVYFRNYALSVNARALIFWENEGFNSITAGNRYVGDPRWTYILAPELGYRPTVGNPSNKTVWQLFHNLIQSAGIETGCCIRGLFEETPSNDNDSGGELRAVISGTSYRYPDLPNGTVLANITSLNRSGSPDFASHLTYCQFLLAMIRYAYDEAGITAFYHDVNPKDDYRIIPGTSWLHPGASYLWLRRELASDNTRVLLHQKLLVCPEYGGPGCFFKPGFFDFSLKINSVGVNWADDIFSYGISAAKAGNPDAGVWFVSQVNTNDGEGLRTSIVNMAEEIRRGSIIMTEDIYFRPENAFAYARAYGEIGVTSVQAGQTTTLTLADGVSRSWFTGFIGAVRTINWGDGQSTNVLGSALTAGHTYALPGSYNVSVTTLHGTGSGTGTYTASKSILITEPSMPVDNGTPRIMLVRPGSTSTEGVIHFSDDVVDASALVGFSVDGVPPDTVTAGPDDKSLTFDVGATFGAEVTLGSSWDYTPVDGSEIQLTSGNVAARASTVQALVCPLDFTLYTQIGTLGTSIIISNNNDNPPDNGQMLPVFGTGSNGITISTPGGAANVVVTNFEWDGTSSFWFFYVSPAIRSGETRTLTIPAGLLKSAGGLELDPLVIPLDNQSFIPPDNAAPTVSISFTSTLVTGTSTGVTAAVTNGNSPFTYAWSCSVPSSVSFSGNTSPTTVTFNKAGTYVVSVLVTDSLGLTGTASGTVTAKSVDTTIVLKASPPRFGQTRTLTAIIYDQFNSVAGNNPESSPVTYALVNTTNSLSGATLTGGRSVITATSGSLSTTLTLQNGFPPAIISG